MPTEQKATASLLSGVFKFVSTEFEHFVANATGSALPDSDMFSDEEEDGVGHKRYLDTPSPPEKHKKTEHHPSGSPTPGFEHHSLERPTLSRGNSLGHREEHVVHDGGGRPPPSRPPLPRALKRRKSISMPGSLFPRSPSIEPEFSSTTDREQRVRFASKIPDSPHPHFSPHVSRPHSTTTSSPPSTPRRRKQHDSAVQAAVGRFQEEDADPSILLPKIQASPHATQQYSRVDKGKGIAVEPTPIDESEASGILRVRGKERELMAVCEDLDRNERRLEITNEAETSLLHQIKQDRDRDKERIKMLEGEIERLKQELMRRPTSITEFNPPPPPPFNTMIALPSDSFSNPSLFASARASLRHAPIPVENPINPLFPASRRSGKPTIGIAPDKMAAFLKEMKTVRLRKVSASDKKSISDVSFMSAPNISMGEGADSSSLSLSRSSVPSMNRASSSGRGLPPGGGGNLSMSEIDSLRGEKRKRTITSSQEELRAPFRLRSTTSSAESSFATSSSSFNPPSLTESSQSYPLSDRPTTSASTPWPPSSATDALTPSLCSDNDPERDETSPDDHLPSTPPITTFYRLRSSGLPVESERPQQNLKDVTTAGGHQQLEHESTSHPEPEPEPEANVNSNSNSKPTVFDKRPPTSPFPHKSPRRPRPPARKSQQTKHSAPSSSHSDNDEDPLSLSFSSSMSTTVRKVQTRQKNDDGTTSSLLPSAPKPKPPPSSSSRSRPSPRHHRSGSESSRSRRSRSRRVTLDQELRLASSSTDPSIRHEEEEEAEDTNSNNNNVLVGVGTRNKRRGFLPGGGGAGVPVFRGVGHVDGAVEDEDEPLEDQRRHSRRLGSSRQQQQLYGEEEEEEEDYLPTSRRSIRR